MAPTDSASYEPVPPTPGGKGSEVSLAGFASSMKALGVLMILLPILGIVLVALNTGKYEDASLSWFMPTIAVLVPLGVGFLATASLMRAGADVIRLLKRTNNLPYSGDIAL